MSSSRDRLCNAVEGYLPLDFTALLTEAIQLYADAVAAHALQAEGMLDEGEDGETVAVARARLRRLLSLIPPMPAPDEECLASSSPPGGTPVIDSAAR